MSIIEFALVAIAESEGGEDVFLCIEHCKDAATDKQIRASLRAPGFDDTYPLFDPETGEHELAACGPDAAHALAALRVVLSRFFG